MPSDDHNEEKGTFEGRSFLLIRDHPSDDGTEPLDPSLPGWLSPDIVVIKPDGSRGGEAVAQQNNQVEVTVHNRGGIGVVDAEVEAFLCGPSTGWTPATAFQVGFGFLSIPGYSAAQLAMPWMPTPSQVGHNCLMARVRSIVPNDGYYNGSMFDVRGDRHVAQRNIHVLAFSETASGDSMQFRFLIVNPGLRGAEFEIEARQQFPRERAAALWGPLGLGRPKLARGKLAGVELGVGPTREAREDQDDRGPRLGLVDDDDRDLLDFAESHHFKLAPDNVLLGSVAIRRDPDAQEGELSIVEIAQRRKGDEAAIGGLWIVAVN